MAAAVGMRPWIVTFQSSVIDTRSFSIDGRCLVFEHISRGTQWIAARQSHHKHAPDFHDKYGNIILLGGALFCVSIWGYVATQTGIEWNLSPVGRVTPKEWREK
ncbi:cytochrome c oxidase subunit 7B, mitochondrial isoform X1 [Mauremys reevesii]|uniref:cytochrome c oxidase subunit 7B, mitochondrial isoform X1 n=1 Tax=Mauremys reevesii TaxID=260615 RepID=UPI00193F189A|nr:cytochrome c oxidase subunit 7B, mitochondrial isoform X1 [Mauremys reevesii]